MSQPAESNQPPRIRVRPPGPVSSRLARRLTGVESRNVTFIAEDFPIFWEKARGSNVWDADGNRYVDLTAGFGVAVAGHRNRRIVSAIRRQIARLPHGMGDVHPPTAKVRLLETIAGLSPLQDTRTVLTSSGAEAVEVALKTAILHTGRPGTIAFSGAYHGLTFGALAVTDRALFRAPFEQQLSPHVLRAPYPHPYRPPEALVGLSADLGDAALEAVHGLLDTAAGAKVGAIIIEPIQGRGGDVVPPPGFLAGLCSLCRERDLVLIADEIYTGLGRTGSLFAFQAESVTPDIVCVGKALSGSLPISACLGTAEVMQAWPASDGEAVHTSTFLGNPTACAAAVASLKEIQRRDLAGRARREGRRWLVGLAELGERHEAVGDVRGRGLMAGLDLVGDRETRQPDADLAGRVIRKALRRGWILLPGGPAGNVISLSPPLTISRELLDASVEMLDEILGEVATDRHSA
jgi:4-aminobutyrate aminotransferase